MAYDNLIFIFGVRAHFEGDSNPIPRTFWILSRNNSRTPRRRWTKVLKCNEYLNDLKGYDNVNEVFPGRFGDEPPVPTIIAAPEGSRAIRLPKSM